MTEYANDRFYKLMTEDQKFTFQLGLFVYEFARAELHIRHLLAQMAGVSRLMANALFSGVKADASLTLIRRVHRAKRHELHPYLEKMFNQFVAINSVRNMILHYGADQRTFWDDETNSKRTAFIATNTWFSVDEENLQTIETSTDDLVAMTEDLHTISFNTYLFQKIRDVSEDERLRRLVEAEAEPWLYKPAAQGSSRRKSPKKTQTPKPPRGSSQK